MNFPINYYGNKFNESKKFLNYNFKEYNFIAEPFCGVFGFSRAIYKNCSDDCIFIMNDINSHLIDIYNYLKDKDVNILYNNLQTIIKDFKSKCTNDFKIKKLCTDLELNSIENKFLYINAINGRHINFYDRLLKTVSYLNNFNNSILHNFLKKCIFTNLDYNDFFTKYRDYGKILFYIDPPYFDSHNMSYQKSSKEILDNNRIYDSSIIYIKIFEFIKSPVNFILVINKLELLHYLFRIFYNFEYEKRYNMSRKLAKHIVYYNIPLIKV